MFVFLQADLQQQKTFHVIAYERPNLPLSDQQKIKNMVKLQVHQLNSQKCSTYEIEPEKR